MSGEAIDTCELNHKFWHDGTNGEGLVAAIGAGAVWVDYTGGTTANMTLNGDAWPVPANRWFSWYFDGEFNGARGVFTTAEVDLRQKEIPIIPQLVTRRGNGNIAAGGLLGGAQNVTVTLDAPMSNDDYVPHVQLLGAPDVIGGHGLATGTPWTVVDADTVTVHVVSAIGAAAVADGVYVTATELV